MKSNQHPTDQQLRAFAAGKLAEVHVRVIEAHLQTCEQCVASLEEMTLNDDLLEGLGKLDPEELELDSEPDISQRLAAQDRYRVIEPLGGGGMGSVYLAEHLVMKRQVAIKVIRPEYVANPEAIARFRNEVRIAAQLSHPNIVTAYDAEQIGDTHFLVMEYVPGVSLTTLVKKRGPLPRKHVFHFALQVAAGLRHAHRKNMVHRDIKPSNLMKAKDGGIKILDFGLARIGEVGVDRTTATMTGVMMGTADYVSPEQARDAKSADPRSDLYSLGCTLFFLLTGKPPYEGATRVDTIIAHCTQPIPDLRTFRSDIPEAQVNLVNRLMAKSPDDRYQDADALIKDLKSIIQEWKVRRNDETVAVRGVPEATDTVLGEEAHLVAEPALVSPAASPPSKSTISGEQTLAYAGVRDQKQPSLSHRMDRRIWLTFAAIGFLAALVSIIWSQWGGAKEGAGKQGSQGDMGQSPHVVLVLSSENFWYSDYRPLADALDKAGIRWTRVSDSKGLALYDRQDTHPGASDVEVSQTIVSLANAYQPGEIDAIVFMGNENAVFRDDSEVGQRTGELLKKLQQEQVWIAGLGKGMYVPLKLGIYQQATLAKSKWVEVESGIQTVDRPVVVDLEQRALTAADWYQATAFSEKLIELLRTERESSARNN